jgi:DNA-binding transcriptional LysR family regulator
MPSSTSGRRPARPAPGRWRSGRPASRRRPLATADLAGERLLVNVPRCSFALAAEALLGVAPHRAPVGSIQVMRACAEQHLGTALFPELAVEPALAAGTLAALDLPTPPLRLRLVWCGDREIRPGLRDVLYAASG